MPILTHTCHSIACDACGETLRDPDSEAVVHFDTETEARRTARAHLWPVTSGPLICPTGDRAHQAAIDALMPAEPPRLDQPSLDDATEGTA